GAGRAANLERIAIFHGRGGREEVVGIARPRGDARIDGGGVGPRRHRRSAAGCRQKGNRRYRRGERDCPIGTDAKPATRGTLYFEHCSLSSANVKEMNDDIASSIGAANWRDHPEIWLSHAPN